MEQETRGIWAWGRHRNERSRRAADNLVNVVNGDVGGYVKFLRIYVSPHSLLDPPRGKVPDVDPR